MRVVVRLVTVVDMDDGEVDARGTDVHLVDGMSFSALHVAVLDDGRRLVLLDDRGWSVSGPSDIGQYASVEDIEADARTVVGPDEPFDSHSQADMKSSHWAYLAQILRHQGVHIEPEKLSRSPHDVELSQRLRARIAGARGLP